MEIDLSEAAIRSLERAFAGINGPFMAKKLRIGIIGTGGIARACHMPAYQALPDQCEIVALCDIKPDVLAKAATDFGVSKTYAKYEDLLKDPEIDAVSVATPNAVHLEPTVMALKAGKHVLCEKPLSMNAEQSKQICRTAKETGKILQVGLQIRFTPQIRFVKQFIEDGGMGDIYYARAHALRRRGVPAWGVFIDKEKQGGGPLIDIGVHILDATLFMMGYPKPISASAQTWNMLGTNPALYNGFGKYDHSKFTVEDFAVGLIRFENGAVVVLESSFMANLDGDPYQTQLFGTKAGALVKAAGDDPVRIYSEQNRQLFNMEPVNLPKVDSPYDDEVKAFVEAIQNGTPSAVPAENGLTLNAIFDAMYASSVSGREEPVDVSV